MADLNNLNIGVIKYLDDKGLKTLWEKISDTYLRDSEVMSALTTYGQGQIITEADKVFIQKFSLDALDTKLSERMDDIEAAQGTNIDGDTIINKDGLLQTDLLLENDKDNHILKIVTGKGTEVSQWDYTEFYNAAVKDGILDNVSLVVVPDDETAEASGQEAGTYLKFIFNTSSGKQPLYVNVTDLIDVYTGSTYIQVDKKNGSSEISIKTTELVNYLKTDEALGITTITTKLETCEDEISGIKTTIKNLQEAWDNLNIQSLIERIGDAEKDIDDIFEVLKTVPNTPISDAEIDALT